MSKKLIAAINLISNDRKVALFAAGFVGLVVMSVCGLWLSLEAFAWMVGATLGEFTQWWIMCMIPSAVVSVFMVRRGLHMRLDYQIGAATYWWLCFGLAWGTAGWIIGAVSMALVIANVAVYRKLAV